jgi:hypothetical protein
MRKIVKVMCVIVLVCSQVGMVSANDFISTDVEIDEKWNLSFMASAVVPTRSDYFDAGISGQVAFTYGVFKWVAVGLETGYMHMDTKWEGVGLGEMHAMPLLADIIVKVPIEVGDAIVIPYIVNGCGALFSDINESKNVNQGTKLETNIPFLFKLGAGVDVYVNDAFSITFETSYQWADLEYEAIFTDNSTATSPKVDMDALYIGGAIKFKF